MEMKITKKIIRTKTHRNGSNMQTRITIPKQFFDALFPHGYMKGLKLYLSKEEDGSLLINKRDSKNRTGVSIIRQGTAPHYTHRIHMTLEAQKLVDDIDKKSRVHYVFKDNQITMRFIK